MKTLELLSHMQAVRTDAYLRTFLHDTSDTAQLQAIFARCCIAGAKLDIDQQLLGTDVISYVAAVCKHPDAVSLNLDPMLVLEAHKILLAHQVHTSGFEYLIDTIASELEAQPAHIRRLGRVRLMAEHLRGFGYVVPRSKPHSDATKLLRSADAWLSAPVLALDDMLDHLVADNENLSQMQASRLSLIALAELRNYRVDVGSKIVRLLLKLRLENEEISEALTFMLLQRRNDGAYGFMSPFDDRNWQRAEIDLRVFLPLTLNVVWALYEACNHGALSMTPVEVAA